jgi:putative ABC transport system substrate-binding protein
MGRREFILGLGGAAAWPLAGRAQQRSLPVIGWLHPDSPQVQPAQLPAFYRGLAEMGLDVKGVTLSESCQRKLMKWRRA